MRTLFAACLVIFFISAKAQPLNNRISNAYQNFKQQPALKYAATSFTVLDAQTSDIIFSGDGNLGLPTASTLKTITSATALDLLGSDYKFKTEIGYHGKINNNSLNGHLITKGKGDPTLGSFRWDETKPEIFFKKILDALKQSRIGSITGDIIVDDMAWGSQQLPAGWIWQDIGNYYGSGSNALVWRENQINISFKPGLKIGDSVKIAGTDIEIPGVNYINELKTGVKGSGDNVYAFSGSYNNEIYLRGAYGIDLKKEIGIAMPDPGYALATELKSYLEKNGFTIIGQAKTTRKMLVNNQKPLEIEQLLFENLSPSLKDIVYWLNKKSVNLFAEQLLKAISINETEISTEKGIDLLQKHWQKQGIDPASINMIDGSGLSPGNRLSTLAMAQILQKTASKSWFSDYLNSFPIYNGMKIKSGTINNTIAYAGYHTAKNGKSYVAVIIAGNYKQSSSAMRNQLFSLLDLLK